MNLEPSTPSLTETQRERHWVRWSILLVVGLHLFSSWWATTQWFDQRPDAYNLVTAAWTRGQLALPIEPHPELLKLENPYDPLQNAPYRVHDASFYKGKYYMYFGAGPVALLLNPWRVLTGYYLTQALATGLFASICFLSATGLLLRLRRRYWPSASTGSVVGGILVMGLGGAGLQLAQSADFYPVPIACAAACGMVGLYSLVRALAINGLSTLWLTLASLAWGAALAARPNSILAAAVLAVPLCLIFNQVRARRISIMRSGVQMVAVILPVVTIGLALLWYNWRRFDSPFEFGMKYQLAGEIFTQKQFLSLENFVVHFYDYLLSPASWSRYFPFFQPATAQPYGVLLVMPVLWLTAAVPAALRVAIRPIEAIWVVRLLIFSAAGATAMVFLFFGVTHRYYGDFLPFLLLLACVGLIGLDVSFSAARGRFLWRGAAVLAVVFSIGINLLVCAQKADPVKIRGLEHALNQPAYLLEKFTGRQVGPVAFLVQFPEGQTEHPEPLLTTGSRFTGGDILMIRYRGERQAQLSFFHLGLGGPSSALFTYEPGRTYRMEIAAGGLYPEDMHPIYQDWPVVDRERRKRELRVSLDDKIIFQVDVPFYPARPGEEQVGRNSLAPDVTLPRFAGVIREVKRLALKRPERLLASASLQGPLRIRLRFPSDRTGLAEPLISTGRRGAGDLLSVNYLEGGRVSFGFDHSGLANFKTEPVAIDFNITHTLEVVHGGLLGEANDTSAKEAKKNVRPFVLKLDGQLLADTTTQFQPVGEGEAVLGFNSVGVATVQGLFFGQIVGFERADRPAPKPAEIPPGALALTVFFPANLITAVEPLVSSGVTGAGDLMYVRYVDARRVAFGFDHWGVGGAESEPVAIDYDAIHRLEITLGSLYGPEVSLSDPRRKQVRVRLDGKIVFSAESPCHPTARNAVKLGENEIGGTYNRTEFTGKILKWSVISENDRIDWR
jgi:hypothetical protein